MNKTPKDIKFHHFDDEPTRIDEIPGTLLNLISLRWPQRIRSYELRQSHYNGAQCLSFDLFHEATGKFNIKYIFYTSQESFVKNEIIAQHDVVLLDLMKPGKNGASLEKQGIICFKHAKKYIEARQIFVVSAYSHQFISETEGVCPLPDQCYSKPLNVTKICDQLIDRIEDYVTRK